jgi:hypothetical protein
VTNSPDVRQPYILLAADAKKTNDLPQGYFLLRILKRFSVEAAALTKAIGWVAHDR